MPYGYKTHALGPKCFCMFRHAATFPSQSPGCLSPQNVPHHDRMQPSSIRASTRLQSYAKCSLEGGLQADALASASLPFSFFLPPDFFFFFVFRLVCSSFLSSSSVICSHTHINILPQSQCRSMSEPMDTQVVGQCLADHGNDAAICPELSNPTTINNGQ